MKASLGSRLWRSAVPAVGTGPEIILGFAVAWCGMLSVVSQSGRREATHGGASPQAGGTNMRRCLHARTATDLKIQTDWKRSSRNHVHSAGDGLLVRI